MNSFAKHLTRWIMAMLVCARAWGAVPEPPQDVQPGWLTRIAVPWNSFTPGNESLIRWSPVPSADSYKVYAYDAPTASWVLAAAGLTNVHHRFYSPETLSDRYRVTAVNTDGESAPSEECVVSSQIADFIIYIGMLPGLSYYPNDITPTNAWLAWTVSITSGADGLVELGTNGTDFTTVYLNTNYVGGHFMWLTNLTPFTLYTYRVSTIGINRGGYSLTGQFYTDDTNRPPVISDMSVAAADGLPAYITLSGTEYTLFEWDMIEEFRILSGPTNGTLSAATLPAWNNSASLVYTPNQNRSFVDHFWYVANDGDLDSAPALVTITHTRNNHPPLAFGTSATGAEDSVIATPLSAADAPSDVLTYIILTPPGHGALSGTAPDLSYTPAPDFHGTDSFVFTANDGELDSNPATVTITVTPVNDAPSLTTIASLAGATEDMPAQIEYSALLAASDATDIDGDALNFRIESIASGMLAKNGVMVVPGTTTIDPGDILVWLPEENINGQGIAAFTIVASDGTVTTTNLVPVPVDVAAVNDAPTLNPVPSQSALEDATPFVVTLNGITSGAPDENEVLAVTVISDNPALLAAPAVNYSSPGSTASATLQPLPNANGTAILTVTVSDGVLSTSRNFTVEVTPLNDPPAIDPVATVQVAEDSGPQSFNISGLSAGPADEPQGITVTVASTLPSLTGTPSVSHTSPATTGLVAFTPVANASGASIIHVTVSDGEAATVLPVQIVVTPVNDAPVATSQTLSTPHNAPLNFTLTGTDVEGSPLSFTVLSTPANGTLSGTGASRTFTPNLNWSGTTSLTFLANDGQLNSAAATITITVHPPTAVPLAPGGLTATTVSRSRIDLAWTDTSNTETGFKIERSANGSTWSQIATAGPNVTTYVSTGLSANKTYYYRVRAYNAVGNSPYSNTASARTLR